MYRSPITTHNKNQTNLWKLKFCCLAFARKFWQRFPILVLQSSQTLCWVGAVLPDSLLIRAALNLGCKRNNSNNKLVFVRTKLVITWIEIQLFPETKKSDARLHAFSYKNR